jgi:hypothetical protein
MQHQDQWPFTLLSYVEFNAIAGYASLFDIVNLGYSEVCTATEVEPLTIPSASRKRK